MEKQVQPAQTTEKKAPVKKEKAPKKVEAVKEVAHATETVVAAPAVEVQAKNTVIATPSTTTLSEDYATFFTKLQSVSAMLSSLKSDFRLLEKKSAKQYKVSQKASSKKVKNPNRSPSGFVQPTFISSELASFLGKDEGTMMARTDVTREINSYIKKHNLQDKSNGRRINADDKLSSLLKLKDDEVLTYFNLQRYMSPHFAKNQKAAPAASV